jgi:hypothetical protein
MVANSVSDHFCYPSGDYHLEFLPWLRQERVVTATTCEAGLASAHDHPLLLPRFVDTSAQSALQFESWLSGVGAFTSRGRRRHKAPVPLNQQAEAARSR